MKLYANPPSTFVQCHTKNSQIFLSLILTLFSELYRIKNEYILPSSERVRKFNYVEELRRKKEHTTFSCIFLLIKESALLYREKRLRNLAREKMNPLIMLYT